MTGMRTAAVVALGLVVALLAAHAWRRVGEIEAQLRAGDDELAHRD